MSEEDKIYGASFSFLSKKRSKTLEGGILKSSNGSFISFFNNQFYNNYLFGFFKGDSIYIIQKENPSKFTASEFTAIAMNKTLEQENVVNYSGKRGSFPEEYSSSLDYVFDSEGHFDGDRLLDKLGEEEFRNKLFPENLFKKILSNPIRKTNIKLKLRELN